MTFTLLPAVDVAGGRVVRAGRGGAGSGALGDPRERALAWQADGAEWLHLVDLDAAYGRGSNAGLLASVIGDLDVDVQLSGGIRDEATLTRSLSTGCARVVLATSALDDPAWCARAIATHGERIAVGLDVRVTGRAAGGTGHRLAARGGIGERGDLWAALTRLDRDGCARYVVTDVSRDGTMRGPALELYGAVTSATPAPVIASGGVSTIGDLVALAEMAVAGANLEGSIVGTALADGRFTLPEALAAMRRGEDTVAPRRPP